ncbi:MAG: glycosyltransferase family 4 protein [Candidatus Saccharimonadales bacterium]
MKKESALRIGFVFDDSLDSPAGVATYVKTLGSWLSSQGHDVRYLVGQTHLPEHAGGKVYSLAKNIVVDFNGNRLSVPLPASPAPILRSLRAEDFDVLHVQMPHSPFFANRVIKLAGPHPAVIGTFHIFPAGRTVSAGSRLLKLSYGRSLRRFDKIISVSEPAAAFAKKAFGLKSEVVPNVIDLSQFNRLPKYFSRPRRQVVFLGRLVERKGCGYLLKAFAKVHKKLPDARLIIAGDGPDKAKLVRKAKRLGVSKAVTFRGFVTEAEKTKLLANADIACFPSTGGESFGIVLLEAMAAGSGVVLAGGNPGYRSVMGPQKDLLIEPKETAAFAAQLYKLLSDNLLAHRLHIWQRDVVRQYDVDVIGPRILQIYSKAIAKRAKSRHNRGKL